MSKTTGKAYKIVMGVYGVFCASAAGAAAPVALFQDNPNAVIFMLGIGFVMMATLSYWSLTAAFTGRRLLE